MNTLIPSNPLAPVVKQVVEGARYLNSELSSKLYTVIKPHLKPSEQEDEEVEVSSFSVTKALRKQMATLERLQTLASGSEDVSEVKSVMTAARDVITQMTKFQSHVESEETLKIVEDSVVEALEELGDEEIKDRFFKILTAKVEIKKQSRSIK